MHHFVIILVTAIGLVLRPSPAQAACEFNIVGTTATLAVLGHPQCVQEINNLANKALDQWKAQKTSLKFGSGTAVNINLVENCQTSDSYIVAANKKNQTIHMCVSYGYTSYGTPIGLPPLWLTNCFIGQATDLGKDKTQKMFYEAYGKIFGACTQPPPVEKPPEKPKIQDTDKDGIADAQDNCPMLSNASQQDADGDKMGDVCDPDDDNDGLSDTLEASNKCNPGKADSDGDGLSDLQEISQYKTKCYLTDTDNDNLSDFDEVTKYGTDPNNKLGDKDGDKITDVQEILGFASPAGKVPANYLKYNDPDTDHDGLTDYEEVFTYVYFGLDPKKADTDGDTLTDGFEINANLKIPEFVTWMKNKFSGSLIDYIKNQDYKNIVKYLHPKKKDTDQDGLHDNEEITYKTLPMNIDTDNDGLMDGEEVGNKKFKLNPTAPDSDSDGILDGNEIGGDLSQELKNYWKSNGGKFVFYKGAPIAPDNPDSDGDSVKDGVEVTGKDITVNGVLQHVTSGPATKDTDNDLLEDDKEYALQTNPNDDDTDDDGLKDDEEVKGYRKFNTGGNSKKDLTFPSEKTMPNKSDTDGDGVKDSQDNCPVAVNMQQEDIDNDAIGDICDDTQGEDAKAKKNTCGCLTLPPCQAYNLALQGAKQSACNPPDVSYFELWMACANARVLCYDGCKETGGKLPEDMLNDEEMQSACTVFLNAQKNNPDLVNKCMPAQEVMKNKISNELLKAAVDAFINGGMQKFEEAWPTIIAWIKQILAEYPDLIKQVDSVSEGARLKGMLALADAKACSDYILSTGQYNGMLTHKTTSYTTPDGKICYNKFELQKYPAKTTSGIGAHEAFHAAFQNLVNIVNKGPAHIPFSHLSTKASTPFPVAVDDFDHWLLQKLNAAGVEIGGPFTNDELNLNNICGGN